MNLGVLLGPAGVSLLEGADRASPGAPAGGFAKTRNKVVDEQEQVVEALPRQAKFESLAKPEGGC